MNNHVSLLQRVNLDLHGPALEVIKAMNRTSDSVRLVLLDPEAGPEKKKRADRVGFAFNQVGKRAKDAETPEGLLASTIEGVVARYNDIRKHQKVSCDATTIMLGERVKAQRTKKPEAGKKRS